MPPVTAMASVIYAVIGVALAIPQLVHLLRTRQVDGLSPAGWVNGLLGFAAWLVYLAAEQSWVFFCGTAAAALPWAGVTAAILAFGGQSTRKEWGATWAWAGILATSLTLTHLGFEPVFEVVLAFSALWSCGPSLMHAWRSATVHGLAPATWWLVAAEAIASIVAGWGLWASVVYGAIACSLSAGILLRYYQGDRETGITDELADAGSGVPIPALSR